jgi:Tfp pilus assembly protein PilF
MPRRRHADRLPIAAAGRGTGAERWFPVAVVVAAVAVYANSLANGFVWDDVLLIVDNPRIKSWDRLLALFTQPLAPGTQYYRPLQGLTYVTDYAVNGLAPAGFHMTNVVLHALAALLFYRVSGLVLRDSLAALVAALLFAVHPIHTEAVAYLSGRTDSLAAIFLLGALLLHEKPFLSAAAFFAALLARESAITLLPLVVLLDASGIVSARRRRERYAAYAVVVMLWALMRASFLGGQPVHVETAAFSLGTRLLTLPKVVLSYLALLVFPVRLHMERDVVPAVSVLDPSFLGPAALLILIAAFLFALRRTAWPIVLGSLWFLVALAPFANVVPLDAFMAEHWLYVPSMGVFMALGWPIAQALRRRTRAPVAAGLVVVLAACAARTVRRNAEWATERTIFEATVRDSPASFRAHSNLGRVYLEAGDAERALGPLTHALSLASTPAEEAIVHSNLALANGLLGRHADAIREYRRAIDLKGADAQIYTNLAGTYLEMGRAAEAKDALEKAIATKPDYAPAHSNLGVVLEQLGDSQHAREAYLNAIRIDPDSMEAWAGLGDIQLAEGRADLAEKSYRSALRLQPDSAALQERLQSALRAQRR